jgi:hypothetical protein
VPGCLRIPGTQPAIIDLPLRVATVARRAGWFPSLSHRFFTGRGRRRQESGISLDGRPPFGMIVRQRIPRLKMASAKPPITIQSTPQRPRDRRGSAQPELPSCPFFILSALGVTLVRNRRAWPRSAPNKPNHPICCHPFSEGCYMLWARVAAEEQSQWARPGAAIADWRLPTGDSTTRDAPGSCRPCAKQTQFGRFWARNGGASTKQSQSSRPGAAIGDCGFGIGDSRTWGPSRSCGQNVKQTQFLRFWAKNGGAPRKQRQSVVGRLPRRCATRNDMTRAIPGDAGSGCRRAGRVFCLTIGAGSEIEDGFPSIWGLALSGGKPADCRKCGAFQAP